MHYQSTRNADLRVSSAEAVLTGLAPDGGLFVPSDLASLHLRAEEVVSLSSKEIATKILSLLLPDLADMQGIVERAYDGKFETEELTPTVSLGEDHLIELFRGPTSAFKDIALSVLPHLIVEAKKVLHDASLTQILTATSGDTGKAALVGFADVPGTAITVFYPSEGISDIQRAQMITQAGENVRVCAIRGNFDDAQSAVKHCFTTCDRDALAKAGITLSSANSINIGRLAPQITYYYKAYADLVRKGVILLGEPVDFIVPTGNFGDILAGYLARRMGLPVGKLVAASNRNRILTDFFETGIYDRRREFYNTFSPSMDILISSNLERALFFESDGNTSLVCEWMDALAKQGFYRLPEEMLTRLRNVFSADSADDEETIIAIREIYQKFGYLADPHTAVGWAVAQKYKRSCPAHAKTVILSTASPYKFPETVLKAIGKSIPESGLYALQALQSVSGEPIPTPLAALSSLPILHKDCIDPSEIQQYVNKCLHIGKKGD